MSLTPDTKVLYGLDDDSRRMVLDTIVQLRERLLIREKILGLDRDEVFPEDIIREMLGSDIGMQLVFIPEAYGGMGGGARDCCAVTAEMSRICLGIATAFFAIHLGSDPIIISGTEEQKQRWLGRIAQGNDIVAYAVTEPEAGSNVAAINTKAEPIVDAQGSVTAYRLNGNKQFISNGGYADFFTVLAKTPEGPSFFIVERGQEGFSSGKPEEKHGIRASNTSPIMLTDVVVPVENLIGGVSGQGLKQANLVFGYTRLMVAAMALGAGRAALDIAIRYASERVQFGSLLAEKQGYTHKLIVPNAVKLTAAQAYIDEIAARLDAGESDLQVEGSIAKLFTTEAADKAANDSMQALGGYGYIHEFEVEKIKRDVKITCIYEGTSEIQQNIISTFRWKKTRKSKGMFYGELQNEMIQADVLSADVGGRGIALAAAVLNKIIHLVHDTGLIKQQYIMFLLADMMTYTEVGGAFIRKAITQLNNNAPDADQLGCFSRIFAAETVDLVCRNGLRIVAGTQTFDQQTIQSFLDGISVEKHLWMSETILNDMDQAAAILFKR